MWDNLLRCEKNVLQSIWKYKGDTSKAAVDISKLESNKGKSMKINEMINFVLVTPINHPQKSWLSNAEKRKNQSLCTHGF